MIIDGDLQITGGFEWRGLVIVTGGVTFSGGGGGKRIMGGLVVDRDVIGGEPTSNPSELTVSGTIDILYSLQTLAKISKAFATYSIVNWREGPNPAEVSA
jgi:hypothetical protein